MTKALLAIGILAHFCLTAFSSRAEEPSLPAPADLAPIDDMSNSPPPTAPEAAELTEMPAPDASPQAEDPPFAPAPPVVAEEPTKTEVAAQPTATPEALPVETPPPVEEAPPVEVATVPAQEKSVASADIYERVALYKLHKPQWGIELTVSPNGFGEDSLVGGPVNVSHPELGGIQDANVRALGVQFDFQPRFLQAAGVFGLGPSLGVYPVVPLDLGRIGRSTAQYYIGGQVRYQLRVFREQPIVPVVGYAAEYLIYHYASGPSGHVLIQGPFFGAWLLLNVLEPSGAADMFINNGVSRSYLVAEMRMMTGGDDNVDIPGKGLFFGLRIEY